MDAKDAAILIEIALRELKTVGTSGSTMQVRKAENLLRLALEKLK